MYWIDILSILIILTTLGFWIKWRKSHSIVEKNTAYNTGLTALRKEIYQECEKNFFL